MKSAWRRLTTLCLAVILGLMMIAPAEAAAKKIKLNYKEATIMAGSSLQLVLSGTTKRVTWSTSDKKVATVSKKGLVKAKKAGEATITAKVGKKKYTCKVTVKDPFFTPTDSVTLKKVGESTTIKIAVAFKQVKVTCKVDNSTVIGVELGSIKNQTLPLKITAKAPGDSVITLGNSMNKKELKIKVTVKSEEQPELGSVLTGDIQILYGRTLEEAQKVIKDTLVPVSGDYVNFYFGLGLKKGKINKLYINSGSKYTLFGVYPGMEWKTAIDKLKNSDLKWEKYDEEDEGDRGDFYRCEQYKGSSLYITKTDGKVKWICLYTNE